MKPRFRGRAAGETPTFETVEGRASRTQAPLRPRLTAACAISAATTHTAKTAPSARPILVTSPHILNWRAAARRLFLSRSLRRDVLRSAEAFTSAVPRPSLTTGVPAQCHDGVAAPFGVFRSAPASRSDAV